MGPKRASRKPTRPIFELSWCDQEIFPDWYPWLQPDPSDQNKFLCEFCDKQYSLSTKGSSAINTHAKSKLHQASIQIQSIKSLLEDPANNATNSDPEPRISDPEEASSSSGEVGLFPDEALKVVEEILSETKDLVWDSDAAWRDLEKIMFSSEEVADLDLVPVADNPEAVDVSGGSGVGVVEIESKNGLSLKRKLDSLDESVENKKLKEEIDQ